MCMCIGDWDASLACETPLYARWGGSDVGMYAVTVVGTGLIAILLVLEIIFDFRKSRSSKSKTLKMSTTLGKLALLWFVVGI